MKDLLGQPLACKVERDAVAEVAEALSNPATPTWTMGRVVTLLSQYFVRDTEAQLFEKAAEDWAAELRGLPAWAISNACRWWIGADNKDRHKRPLPGDISEIARREMMPVRAALLRVEGFDSHGPRLQTEPQEQQEPQSPNLLSAEDREARRIRAREVIAATFPHLNRQRDQAAE